MAAAWPAARIDRMAAAGDRRRADVTTVELVGGVEALRVGLHAPDPAWEDRYHEHRRRILGALSGVPVEVEHIGSTSVPGLAAKPIVDIVVVVEDITAEEDYVVPLLRAGYVLRVREPGHDDLGHQIVPSRVASAALTTCSEWGIAACSSRLE